MPGITLSGTQGLVGGTSALNVRGNGSAVIVDGDTGFINVGRHGGTAQLNITNGGQVYGGGTNGLVNMNVARLGSNATLNIDGAGSKLTLSGICVVNSGCDGHGAFLGIGRDSGSVGTVSVTNGGAILVRDGGQAASGGGLGILVGWDDGTGAGAGSGSLTVSGANSSVTVLQTGAGAKNPFINVGDAGTGTMTVSDHATVAVNGTIQRNFIVGNNAGGDGTLTVSGGAAISASWFTVGNNGGTGTATIDGAAVNIDGVSISGSTITGGGFRVGRGTGSVGTLNIQNAASITINTATTTPEIYLGGTGALTGGNGTVNISGGSSISFIGTGATPGVNIGHSGTGLFTMTGGSTLSLPDDGRIVLGNTSSGNGTLQLGGGSTTIGTGFLTVGNNGQGSVVMTGGTVNLHTTSVHDFFTLIVGGNSGSVGTFSQSGGVVNANDGVTLGWFGASSGTYTLTGGTLNSTNMAVGDRGIGVFVNIGPVAGSAIHNVNGNLTVGGDTTSNGSYTITGNNAQTNVNFVPSGNGPTNPPGGNGYDPITALPRPAPNGAMGVGIGGIGTFTQGAANFSGPGNAVAVAGDLVVGVFTGGQGTYTLNTGALTVGGKMVIGAQSQSANVFTQNGGSVTVTGAASGNAAYVGLGGNELSGSLMVGGGINEFGGGTGTYLLKGGTVTVAGNVIVGAGNNTSAAGSGGTGFVTQTAGSMTIAGGLTIGQGSGAGASAGGTGEYVLNGGSLTVTGQTIVGGGGADSSLGGIGTLFVLNGATMHAGTLLGIGSDAGGSNGATGSVILDGSANIYATNVNIGAGGCLGGNGTVHGNVVMNGVSIGDCNTGVTPTITATGSGGPGFGIEGFLKPGRSPGRIVIDGTFDFISGTIVLDVQSVLQPDGTTTFLTDELVFTSNSNTGFDPLDLAGLNIVYAFLGDTDPNAFNATGDWVLDTFFKINTSVDPSAPAGDLGISNLTDPTTGLVVPLDTLFAGSQYSATSAAFEIPADFALHCGRRHELGFQRPDLLRPPCPSRRRSGYLLGSLLLLRSAGLRRLAARARRA